MKITKDQLTAWDACRDGKAGEGIEAGDGGACFAGLRLRVADWARCAQVIAKSKPAHLVGGHWVEPAAAAESEAE